MNEKENTTRHADLNEQSTTALTVGSQSMNLVDDTAKHLFALMKGLTHNLPDAEIKSFDPDKVNAATNCAKQIYQMMRLKLDVIKELRK